MKEKSLGRSYSKYDVSLLKKIESAFWGVREREALKDFIKESEEENCNREWFFFSPEFGRDSIGRRVA